MTMTMNNIAFAPIKFGHETRVVTLQENGVSMLRAEQEFMIDENDSMRKIVAAATLLVARLDRVSLPGGAAMAALTLAGLIEDLPKAMLNNPRR